MNPDIEIVRGVEPDAILNLNLTTYCESDCSGSQENVIDEVPITDGFTVKDKGEVIGWAVIFEKDEAHFFVDAKYRRQGIGRKLYSLCAELKNDLQVSRWNWDARMFFNAVGAPHKRPPMGWY